MKSSLAPHRPKQDSWLSLVAETAGMADCSIARVELQGPSFGSGDRRVIVQVLGANGAVLGAATWTGPARDLARGVVVDLGYSGYGGASTVMAWIDPSDVGAEPFFSAATSRAVTAPLVSDRASRLMLADAVVLAA